MTGLRSAPLIGVTACCKRIDDHPFHAAGEKYLTGVTDGAGGVPLIIPALAERIDPADLLRRLDGLVLTGSPSNVEPWRYGGPPSRAGTVHDPRRDAAVLPLIEQALATGVPLLALCRGFQELNVALGGTLHQHLEEVPGRINHRRDPSLPFAEQYAPRHPVRLEPGGRLAALWGAPEVEVNSLHGQGIDRLAPGLVCEARAADGTIEAARVAGARNFALGVQWHPEWRVRENPFYLAIFEAFGEAARARAALRERHGIAEEVA